MNAAYNPGPRWREHFDFKESYPNVDKSYRPEPLLVETEIKPEFRLDPVLHKFDFKNT